MDGGVPVHTCARRTGRDVWRFPTVSFLPAALSARRLGPIPADSFPFDVTYGYHYDSHVQLRQHLCLFIDACNQPWPPTEDPAQSHALRICRSHLDGKAKPIQIRPVSPLPRLYRTKPEIALAEIDRVRSTGLRFGGILADAGYGLSGPFRQALTERGLTWAVGIPYKQKVHPADVAIIFPITGRGRPRKNHVPDVASRPAQEVLESARWQTVSWRRGSKGKLSVRFAAMRVRVAAGPPQRIGDLGQQHLPGEEVWLVGEHCSTGECKYYLSNLPADTLLRKLAGAIRPAGSARKPINS